MTRYAFLFRSNVSFLRALRIASVPGQEQQKAKDLGVGFLSHWHAKSSCQTRGWEMCHVQTDIPSKQINSKIRPHRHSGKGPSELTKTERPLGGLSCLSRFRCYRLGSWWGRLKQSFCRLQGSQKSHPANACAYKIWIWLKWPSGEGKDRTMSQCLKQFWLIYICLIVCFLSDNAKARHNETGKRAEMSSDQHALVSLLFKNGETWPAGCLCVMNNIVPCHSRALYPFHILIVSSLSSAAIGTQSAHYS